MGWTASKNGALIALAANSFDVFVTIDQNIPFQQNLAAIPIAVLVLRAKSNRLAYLKPLIPQLLAAIERAKPGIVEAVSL
jgi:hypothetical protein